MLSMSALLAIACSTLSFHLITMVMQCSSEGPSKDCCCKKEGLCQSSMLAPLHPSPYSTEVKKLLPSLW